MTVADLRPALKAFLLADSAIGGIVDATMSLQSGGSRIFPNRLPQGIVKPSIVYTLISDAGDYHMQGASGLAHPRYQIDAWAQTVDLAASLALAIKNAIDGYRGTMGSGDALVNVQGVFRDSAGREDFDETARLYRSGRDYFIWFGER